MLSRHVLREKELRHYGKRRIKLQILEIDDVLQHVIDTSEPYQTLLDPPPGPPSTSCRCLNGNPANPSPPPAHPTSIH